MFEEEKDDIESVVEEKKDDLETESESETVKDSDDEEEDDDYNEDDEENNEMSDNELPVAQKQPSAFLEPDDDEEDDDDNDDDYLQKFDDSIKQKIIEDYHPELKTHNYDEIEALSRVVRDNNGTIIDPLHKTLPFITKYEKARVLGERATQLNSGAKPFIEVDADIIDGYVIALKEFEQKKIPFIIKRPLPSGGIEYWKLEDLEFI
jgi:DNA-directed RNA polymerase I, II, and III subunit RPABC2